MSIIHTKAILPDDLDQAWLQHLRDFDAAHPGCHFEVVADTDQSTANIMRMLDSLDPPLDMRLFARRKKDS